MGRVRRSIMPVPLEAGAWAPFGWLPVADTDPADGAHTLEYRWADVHLNIIGHARAEVPATAAGLRCDMLYRHDTHTQALMVLDHPAVLAVAPPGADLATDQDADAVRAFLLQPLQPLVLHRSTWHWGPFPAQAEMVRLLNVQGRRYAEDNAMVDLAARGLSIEVSGL